MARKRSAPGSCGLSIRVDVGPGLQIGPGKVALLEAIQDTGSISAAGRKLRMSYKRAWDLVEALNRGCAQPVVQTSPGGKDGGGTSLTPTGAALIRLYREIEQGAARAAAPQLDVLGTLAAQPAA